MKFKEGDKVKFKNPNNIGSEFCSGKNILPHATHHGSINLHKNYDAYVVGYSNSGKVVINYLDNCDQRVQLGFDEENIDHLQPQKPTLEEVKKRYPIGTKYKSADSGEIPQTVNSHYFVYGGGNTHFFAEEGKGSLWYKGKWAEIIGEGRKHPQVGDYLTFHDVGGFVGGQSARGVDGNKCLGIPLKLIRMDNPFMGEGNCNGYFDNGACIRLSSVWDGIIGNGNYHTRFSFTEPPHQEITVEITPNDINSLDYGNITISSSGEKAFIESNIKEIKEPPHVILDMQGAIKIGKNKNKNKIKVI